MEKRVLTDEQKKQLKELRAKRDAATGLERQKLMDEIVSLCYVNYKPYMLD